MANFTTFSRRWSRVLTKSAIAEQRKPGSCLRLLWRRCYAACVAEDTSISCMSGFESGMSNDDTQERLWKDLFSNPTDWWDNRLEKRSYRHPDFRHKKTREPLWLDSYKRPAWVDSRLVILDTELQSGLSCRVPSASALGDYDLHSLCEGGQLEKALDVLLLMDEQGTVPSLKMYASLLKACTKKKALVQAKQVQAHLSSHGLETSMFLGETLVATLIKCNSLKDALNVFYKLPDRSVFSWTSIISGYTMAGHNQEALRLYKCMREDGVEPNAYTFVSLIKAGSGIGDLEEGKRIHAEVLRYKCETDLFVRTSLVDMYAKCGSIEDAHAVFEEATMRDVVSWNSMIAAYAHQGCAESAMDLYSKMQQVGVSPNEWTLASVVQACGNAAEGGGDRVMLLNKGRALHADVHRRGYDGNIYVSTSLLTMYAKCGSIVDARNVFDTLSKRDVVAWTAMIAAYSQQGRPSIAFNLYKKMRDLGLSPNERTFVSALEACSRIVQEENLVPTAGQVTRLRCLEEGRRIHADAQGKGCQSSAFVGNALISMYGMCGSIVDARRVFDGLTHRDVVSWTAMFAAYVEQGQAEEAVQLYEKMLVEGPSPNARTFVTLAQACALLADKEKADSVRPYKEISSLENGRALHANAKSKGFDTDCFVANTLICMYGKCRSVVDARDVFDGLSQRDLVSWNVMLAAYIEQGQANSVLLLYEEMLEEGVSPNDRSFVTALQACGILAEKEGIWPVSGLPVEATFLNYGKVVHGHAWRKGLDSDAFVGCTLVSMYRKCGSVVDVYSAFSFLLERNVIAWNTILALLVELDQAVKVIQHYEEMQVEGISPNNWTFVSLFQACAMLSEEEEGSSLDGKCIKIESLEKGKAAHAAAWRKGFLSDVFVSNTLVSMYGKCGNIEDAQDVFDGLGESDVVSFTVLLTAYTEVGQAARALELYKQMQAEGVSPDVQTFMCVLQACSMLADAEEITVLNGQAIKAFALEVGKAIHAEIKRNDYDLDAYLGSTLVSIYGKCGSLLDSQKMFDGLPYRDTVLWTAMLTACLEQGQAEQAVQLYERMNEDGVIADETTVLCVLHASGMTGSLETCRQLHREVVPTIGATGGSGTLLANTLIHAYGKCASMIDAQAVFDELPLPDVVSWNALIAGYARQGNSGACFECYERMLFSGMQPNGVTFLSLLSACSHGGLLDTGVEFFESMCRDHGLAPEMEHYVSMIDLLGRAGWFQRVEDMLSSMPVEPDLAVWLCLLNACRKHRNVDMGRYAFDRAVRLDPKHSAPYLLIWSMYADAGLWDFAKEVKALRRNIGALKKPGQSWIQHDQEVHSFLVRDEKYRQQEKMFAFLKHARVKGGLCSATL